MKATSSGLLLLSFLLSAAFSYGQEKYQGTVVTKLGIKQPGTITLNLNGPNNELIEIIPKEQTKKNRNKKVKETVSSSFKLNVALINYIIINDTTWYLRDIKYDYKSKYYMNVCVRLIEGTLDCGIFQTGLSKEMENISIKLPNDEFSKLVSVDFDYYKATLGWHIMAFGKCPTLKTKMEGKQAGYTWDDNTSQSQRITMWKNWVREFNTCKF